MTTDISTIKKETGAPADGTERLREIAAEIQFYSANLLMNIIEIGRRFEEAKSICPRGEWGAWVKESTGYELSMCENYIKIYREYGGGQLNFGGDFVNSQSIGTLGVTKLLELTRIPADEREAFVDEHDITSDTTVKELRELIKASQAEKEKADKEISSIKSKLAAEHDRLAERKAEAERLKAELDEVRRELARAHKAEQAAGNQELLKINLIFEDVQKKITDLRAAFKAVDNEPLEKKVFGVLAGMIGGGAE